jgi:hypothetical protein
MTAGHQLQDAICARLRFPTLLSRSIFHFKNERHRSIDSVGMVSKRHLAPISTHLMLQGVEFLNFRRCGRRLYGFTVLARTLFDMRSRQC